MFASLRLNAAIFKLTLFSENFKFEKRTEWVRERIGEAFVKRSELEQRVKALERKVHRVEAAIGKIAKEFELTDLLGSFKHVEPLRFAKDDLDKQIINLLLEKRVMTANEIAVALGQNRHKIGKRLKRIEKESKQAGEHWLEFNPEDKDGHFRAWWVTIEGK